MRVVTLIELFQQMRSNKLVHGEHGDPIFASHDCFEVGITNDFALVVRVLQVKEKESII